MPLGIVLGRNTREANEFRRGQGWVKKTSGGSQKWPRVEKPSAGGQKWLRVEKFEHAGISACATCERAATRSSRRSKNLAQAARNGCGSKILSTQAFLPVRCVRGPRREIAAGQRKPSAGSQKWPWVEKFVRAGISACATRKAAAAARNSRGWENDGVAARNTRDPKKLHAQAFLPAQCSQKWPRVEKFEHAGISACATRVEAATRNSCGSENSARLQIFLSAQAFLPARRARRQRPEIAAGGKMTASRPEIRMIRKNCACRHFCLRDVREGRDEKYPRVENPARNGRGSKNLSAQAFLPAQGASRPRREIAAVRKIARDF
ncbi:hypothetical protein B0H17DRAFT_1139723 [Mycena rosella]|uniref:Uncharacterized protein n=1 Tax=Mycena rosella TaxID=1033263 RepID=A0AAD7D3Y6_MYCRO|nr:hypothetical protein B0H17DRAFT_1139723 [Mycena rosella]